MREIPSDIHNIVDLAIILNDAMSDYILLRPYGKCKDVIEAGVHAVIEFDPDTEFSIDTIRAMAKMNKSVFKGSHYEMLA